MTATLQQRRHSSSHIFRTLLLVALVVCSSTVSGATITTDVQQQADTTPIDDPAGDLETDARPALSGDQFAGDWPTAGHDSARTGTTQNSSGPKSDPDARWIYEFANDDWSVPIVVSDGLVFVAGYETLRAVDNDTGEEVWNVTNLDNYDEILAANGVVVTTESGFGGEIHAYHATNGTEIWNKTSFDASASVILDGTLYVARGDYLYAIDLQTGTEQWYVKTSDDISLKLSASGDTVYATGQVNTRDYAVYALNASDGSERWRFEMEGPVSMHPVIVNGSVYVGAGSEPRDQTDGAWDPKFYRLNATDGHVEWVYDVNTRPHGAAVADGVVYLAAGNTVRALDVATGEQQWLHGLPGSITYGTHYFRVDARPPVVADGVVYAVNDRGHMSALDGATGDHLWDYRLEGFAMSPAVADDRVYVHTTDSDSDYTRVYALEEPPFQFTGFAPSKTTVEPGEQFTVEVTVENVDDETRDYNLSLRADLPYPRGDPVLGWKNGTLAPGDQETLTFTTKLHSAASWNLSVQRLFETEPSVGPVTVNVVHPNPDGRWSMDGFETNRSDGNPNTDGPSQYFQQAWNVSNVDEDTTPIVDNGTVYAIKDQYRSGQPNVHAIVAYDVRTGTFRWEHNFTAENRNPAGSPTVVNDTVYVVTTPSHFYDGGGPTEHGSVYAFDATNGNQNWKTSVSINQSSSFDHGPVVANGLVYTAGAVYEPNSDTYTNGSVVALDVGDGHVVWSDHLTERSSRESYGTYAVGEGHIFLTASDEVDTNQYEDELFAYDATSGSLEWTTDPLDLIVDQSRNPVVSGGLVFVVNESKNADGDRAHELVALNVSNGAEEWRLSPPNITSEYVDHDEWYLNEPAVYNGTLLVRQTSAVNADYNRLHRIDVSTGNVVWTRSTNYLRHIPVVDGIIYGGETTYSSGYIRLYDAETGEKHGDSMGRISVAVANGTVLTYEPGDDRMEAVVEGGIIEFTDLSVDTHTINEYENVTVTATATNVGDLPRKYTVNLDVAPDDHSDRYFWESKERRGTLAPGESTTLSWNVRLDTRGDFMFFLQPSVPNNELDHYALDNAGSATVHVGDDRDGTVIDLGSPRDLAPDTNSWPKESYDAGNTGNATDAGAPTAVKPNPVNWSVNHSNEWTSGPTLANDTVFAGGSDGGDDMLYAYNATDGSLRWQYPTAGDIEIPPVYASGYLYTADSRNRVYQFNATTGERLWTFNAGGDIGGITVVDDIAYVTARYSVYFDGETTSEDRLYALNATTREVLWTFSKPSTSYGMAAPAVENGTIYVTHDGQGTYAVNATTGVEEWSEPIAGSSSRLHSPVVKDSVVYVDDATYSGTSSNIYALDATNGSTIWSASANVDGYTGSSPALAYDTLYFTADGAIQAVNATNGNERWHNTICSAAEYSPVYADGVIYVPMTDSTLRAFDADTGDLVWRYGAYDEEAFTPAVVNGLLYATGLENSDYTYSLLALEGGPTSTPKTLFSFSGLSVSSENISTDESFTVSATVSNQGDASCEYSANFAVDETVVDTTTGTVDPGYHGRDTASFTHSFASTGTYNVTIEDLPPVQVNVSAPEPDIDVSPTSHDFGDVNVSEYEYVDIAISNVGDENLYWSDVRLASGDTGEFDVTSDPTDSYTYLWPSGTKYARVYFMPTSGGTKTATVEILSDDPDEPTVAVTLTGNAVAGHPDVNVTPSFVDFGDVPVNGSTTKTVTVTNDGDETLTVSGASASPGEYSVTAGGSGDSLAPGASTTVDVTFAPTSMGTAPGSLSIASDDPDTPTAIVELTGNATAEPAPAIAVNRTSYYFEGIPVDSTSQATFELSNTGTAPLEISGTTLSGVDAGAFTVTTATPVVVQPGSNTTLTVEFTPTSLGPHIATLNVSHNDTAASPTSIELGGTSIDTTPPTVSITDVNGTAVNGTTVYANDTVVVNGTATDQHGSVQAVTVDLVSTFTTFTHTTNATYDAGTGNWSATVVLAQVVDDGVYHVVVAAEDDSGNTNTATATEVVDVDRRPPEISTVMNRVDESTARVNVTADDRIEDGSLAVTVDRPDDSTVPVTLTESNGKWTGTFALAGDGQYNATASARDAAGNQGVANATILFENRSTDANNTITVKVVPSNLFVRFTTNQPVEDTFITMTSSRTPLAPLVRGNAGVNFIDAVLGKKLTANLSYATIGIPVDESLLPPNTSPDDVTIRYFNETTRQWEDVATTREHVTLEDGTSGEYWVANVSHFSTYGAIVTDTTAPTITDTSPTTGHEYAAGTTKTTLGVDYADSLSGVNASAVTLTFDGSDVTTDSATSITSKRATYQATGLTNGSSHTLVVSIEDHAGNTATETITFDVATPSSSTPSNPGSGGSGGSGSGTPPTTTTPPANTDDDPVATPDPVVDIQALAYGIFDATVSNARANARNTFTFPGGDLDADGVTLAALDFTATADGDYAFQVSTSTDLPRGTAALDGETATALAYVNVSHPNVSNALIANATFHLTVSQERLDDAGVAASDLTVYRFSNGTWTPLETSVVETTADAVVLEANSPGLSVFAVGARQAQTEVTTTEQPPQTTAPATTAAPADTSTPKTSNENVGGDDADDDDVPDIGASTASIVLIGLLALLAALAVVLHRRRS